uniref:Condensin complex subunit 2 n=1 Tax=Steinernema glaseri TaxID=37863 RepID=A0A1I8A3X3_9BILA
MDDDDFNTLSYDDPTPFAPGERQAGFPEDEEDGENLGNMVTGRGIKRPADVADLAGIDTGVDMAIILLFRLAHAHRHTTSGWNSQDSAGYSR